MKLPDKQHSFWIVAVIGLLVVSDTATSVLLYDNGYDTQKDPWKTTAIVTVLLPLLAMKIKGDSHGS